MKRALLIAAVFLCEIAVLEASAHGPGGYARHGKQHSELGGRWEGGHGGHADRLAELNLSESQKDRIAKVRESHQKDVIKSRADLELAQLEFRKLMRDDNPDKRAINAQIDRMASIRADMMKSRVEQRLQVRDVLTADQRAKFQEGRGKRGMVEDEEPSRDQDSRRP